MNHQPDVSLKAGLSLARVSVLDDDGGKVFLHPPADDVANGGRRLGPAFLDLGVEILVLVGLRSDGLNHELSLSTLQVVEFIDVGDGPLVVAPPPLLLEDLRNKGVEGDFDLGLIGEAIEYVVAVEAKVEVGIGDPVDECRAVGEVLRPLCDRVEVRVHGRLTTVVKLQRVDAKSSRLRQNFSRQERAHKPFLEREVSTVGVVTITASIRAVRGEFERDVDRNREREKATVPVLEAINPIGKVHETPLARPGEG